jgi:phosphoglycolate phosphatase-like HAD superfamily hydrolase
MSVRAAVFDIDGVLADSFWRGHYIWKNKPDWEGFFEACPNDPPQALAALPPSWRMPGTPCSTSPVGRSGTGRRRRLGCSSTWAT